MVKNDVDVVVVGAGFAGLYLLHRLRGAGLTTRCFEGADGVGGTWYWNRYPGARCDIESLEYSYSFDPDLEQEWEWSERYATQPEILRYLEHVTDRFGLRDLITFETRVAGAAWDESVARWQVTTDTGETVSARFVVMATGCLSSAQDPQIPGLSDFEGETLYTARWPHEAPDLAGKRVGVIGTGSSAIQSIPIIAEQCGELTVFQRTPNYTVPAHNRPLTAEEIAAVKADYPAFRERNRQLPAAFGANLPFPTQGTFDVSPEERERVFEERWALGGLGFLGGFVDSAIVKEANDVVADFVRGKIRSIVDDPTTAADLSPDQVIGCKRMCVDTGYYATFNRENVRLVNLRRQPLERIVTDGVVVGDEHVALDVLVLATGFDAMTGSVLKVDFEGRNGLKMSEAWEAGPRTYLGLGVEGFPNLFLVTGPGSPSVLTNMVMSIEQHVEWISDCITWLDANGHPTIEATGESVEMWVNYVNAVAGLTLFPTCNSWYLGANIPGKTRVFMPLPGFPPYAETCRSVAEKGYDGFVLGSGALDATESLV